MSKHTACRNRLLGRLALSLLLVFVVASLPVSAQESSVFDETLKAATNGVAEAQYDLGVMYARGRGAPQDLSEAAGWFLKAAEQGHAIAQTVMAVMYENGDGVPQDIARAVEWYSKAAEQGRPAAQYKLGEFIPKGLY